MIQRAQYLDGGGGRRRHRGRRGKQREIIGARPRRLGRTRDACARLREQRRQNVRAVKVKHKLNVFADLAFLERLHLAAPAIFDEAALLEVRMHEIGDLRACVDAKERAQHIRAAKNK